MVGITLSPEQVRDAPPEVRRWLEQQIAESLGFRRPPAAVQPPRHLIGCNVDALRSIFSTIQAVLPVVGVFFELAREPAPVSPQGLRVLHVDEVTRHCRLQAPAQAIACLQALDRALKSVTGDPEAVLTVVDSNEHILVPDVTARGIHALWEELVSARAAPPAPPGAADAAAAVNSGQSYRPYAINVNAPSTAGGMPTA